MNENINNYWKCPNCNNSVIARLTFCSSCGKKKPVTESVGPQNMVPSNTDSVNLKEQ